MPIRIPKIKRCFCVSLQTAATFCGILRIIIFVCVCIYFLMNVQKNIELSSFKWDRNMTLYITSQYKHSLRDREVLELFVSGEVIFTTTLLIGIYKKNFIFMIPYLVRFAVVVGFFFLSWSLLLISRFSSAYYFLNGKYVTQLCYVLYYSIEYLIMFNYFRYLKHSSTETQTEAGPGW